jgi:anti-anti-sigma factor
MQDAPEMLAVRQEGEILVVTLQRNIGVHDEAQLADDIELLERRLQPGIQCLVIDFASATFIASSLLSALILLWKQVRVRNGQAAVCNLSGNVREVLHRTRLDTMWPVCASQQEALTRVKASAECGMSSAK